MTENRGDGEQGDRSRGDEERGVFQEIEQRGAVDIGDEHLVLGQGG